MRDQENVEDRAEIAKEHQVPDVTFFSFLWQYSWHLWAASTVFSVVQFVFFGQVIVMEPIVKVLGYNKTQGWQGQVDEQYGYVIGWVSIYGYDAFTTTYIITTRILIFLLITYHQYFHFFPFIVGDIVFGTFDSWFVPHGVNHRRYRSPGATMGLFHRRMLLLGGCCGE